MCGIAGRVGATEGSASPLDAMVATLDHRGPDDRGYFRAPGVELGMARLAIVDVAHGQQPTLDNSGSIVATFNGEIYNFVELREELIKEGYRFSSDGDCEVIANLFHRYGKRFVSFLRGMFAIAIWDARDESLYLVRDRVGKKPLLYSQTPTGIVFASEARALIKAGISQDVDFIALNEVLNFGYINSPRTIYSKISSLPPATILCFHKNKLSVEKYWSLDLLNKKNWSQNQSLIEVEGALRDSVRVRTKYERTSGIYLSGGVDSSLIAKYLFETLNQNLNSYSVRFSESAYDETRFAQDVAARIGTQHYILDLEVSADSLWEVIGSLDQPFADSSYFATYQLNKAAHEHIVVAFGGDGGDEAMAGYDRYRASVAMQQVNAVLTLAAPLRPLVRALGRKGTRLADLLIREKSLAERYRHTMTLINPVDLAQLLSPPLKHDISSHFASRFNSISAANELEKLVAMDFESYLPGDLMVKADWASMAHGIELRSPMLDHKFLEVCAQVPTRYRSSIRGGKLLLKELATKAIPGVDFKRSKMGFGIPLAKWLRGPFLPVMEEILLGEACRNRSWFNHEYLSHVIAEHKAGKDRDNILWPALIIESWASKWQA
jgi:asparagine synthase (glutamine-hydrolysing)